MFLEADWRFQLKMLELKKLFGPWNFKETGFV